MKIGDRVKILIGLYKGSEAILKRKADPYDWEVQLPNSYVSRYDEYELQLVGVCPCNIKSCLAHRLPK